MPDLSDPDFFARFIGSFWKRAMTDRNFIDGVAAASASEITRSYISLVNAIQKLSIETADVLVPIGTHPIIFRQSDFSNGPDYLKFGDGQKYGPQEAGGEFRSDAIFEYAGLERKSDNFYVGLKPGVSDVGMSLSNSLVSPTLTLVRGIDFVLKDGVVTFRENPFDNPLIHQMDVTSSSGQGEKEIVLWSSDASEKNGDFAKQFGFASGTINPLGENYQAATKASLLSMSGGPTMTLIDHLVAALVGLPCITSDHETILSVTDFKGMRIVATDLGVYKIHPSLSLRKNIQVGAVLERGHPLTTGTEVFDSKTNPSWWSGLEGLVFNETFFGLDLKSSIGFRNEPSVVELSGPEESVSGDEWRSAKFFIAGRKEDVDAFWKASREAGLKSQNPTGNAIYRHLGAVNEDGAPDFARTVIINPLELIASNIIGTGAIVIRIQLSSFFSLEDFFVGSELVRKAIPPHLGLIVIIDISTQESVFFQRQDDLAVEPQNIPLTSTWDLIRENLDDFPVDVRNLWTQRASDGTPLTVCPEAVSLDMSPGISSEVVSFGDKDENEVSYGAPTKPCEESIESAIIPVCKP